MTSPFPNHPALSSTAYDFAGWSEYDRDGETYKLFWTDVEKLRHTPLAPVMQALLNAYVQAFRACGEFDRLDTVLGDYRDYLLAESDAFSDTIEILREVTYEVKDDDDPMDSYFGRRWESSSYVLWYDVDATEWVISDEFEVRGAACWTSATETGTFSSAVSPDDIIVDSSVHQECEKWEYGDYKFWPDLARANGLAYRLSRASAIYDSFLNPARVAGGAGNIDWDSMLRWTGTAIRLDIGKTEEEWEVLWWPVANGPIHAEWAQLQYEIINRCYLIHKYPHNTFTDNTGDEIYMYSQGPEDRHIAYPDLTIPHAHAIDSWPAEWMTLQEVKDVSDPPGEMDFWGRMRTLTSGVNHAGEVSLSRLLAQYCNLGVSRQDWVLELIWTGYDEGGQKYDLEVFAQADEEYWDPEQEPKTHEFDPGTSPLTGRDEEVIFVETGHDERNYDLGQWGKSNLPPHWPTGPTEDEPNWKMGWSIERTNIHAIVDFAVPGGFIFQAED